MTALDKSFQALRNYFHDLDDELIGIEKAEDEVFHYEASDVLVQSSWELPIVIQWPDSEIHYEFSVADPSEISFGLSFVAAPEEEVEESEELDIEQIIENQVVRNEDGEPVSGSLRAPCEGVFFFMWDNSYDWSSVKRLKYSITVKQPSFTLPDEERSMVCIPQVQPTVDDLLECYIREADANDKIDHLSADLSFLNDQMAALKKKLAVKQSQLDSVSSVFQQAIVTIDQGEKLMPGLCVRTLDKDLLSIVLSYLGPDSNSRCALVNKYWLEITRENKINNATQGGIHSRTIHNKRTAVDLDTSSTYADENGKVSRKVVDSMLRNLKAAAQFEAMKKKESNNAANNAAAAAVGGIDLYSESLDVGHSRSRRKGNTTDTSVPPASGGAGAGAGSAAAEVSAFAEDRVPSKHKSKSKVVTIMTTNDNNTKETNATGTEAITAAAITAAVTATATATADVKNKTSAGGVGKGKGVADGKEQKEQHKEVKTAAAIAAADIVSNPSSSEETSSEVLADLGRIAHNGSGVGLGAGGGGHKVAMTVSFDEMLNGEGSHKRSALSQTQLRPTIQQVNSRPPLGRPTGGKKGSSSAKRMNDNDNDEEQEEEENLQHGGTKTVTTTSITTGINSNRRINKQQHQQQLQRSTPPPPPPPSLSLLDAAQGLLPHEVQHYHLGNININHSKTANRLWSWSASSIQAPVQHYAALSTQGKTPGGSGGHGGGGGGGGGVEGRSSTGVGSSSAGLGTNSSNSRVAPSKSVASSSTAAAAAPTPSYSSAATSNINNTNTNNNNNNNNKVKDKSSKPLRPPAIAESKNPIKVKPRISTTTTTTEMVGVASKKPRKKQQRHSDNQDESALIHLKKIRSEHQLSAMIEYLENGFAKMENISIEKRRVKKLIQAWNKILLRNNEKIPADSERKGRLREMYEEYHQLQLALKVRSEKMDAMLKSVGLDKQGFEGLRDRHAANKW